MQRKGLLQPSSGVNPSHLTISIRGQRQRETGKIERNNYHHAGLTQQFLKFRCLPCVKIKDTDDVLPVKEGPQLP